MESSSSSQKNSRDVKGSRRTWSHDEEKAVIDSFYHIMAEGFKQENGQFRNGYVAELEKYMLKLLPNTDLRERPHIESKIKFGRSYMVVSMVLCVLVELLGVQQRRNWT